MTELSASEVKELPASEVAEVLASDTVGGLASGVREVHASEVVGGLASEAMEVLALDTVEVPSEAAAVLASIVDAVLDLPGSLADNQLFAQSARPATSIRTPFPVLSPKFKTNFNKNCKTNFNFMTLNVQGLRNVRNRQTLFSWLNCAKPDFICLQETHPTSEAEYQTWVTSETNNQNNMQHYLLHSSPGSARRAGVAILYKPCF